jgi:hypothetical protein
MKERLKFVKITEQTKAWSAALGEELSGWQSVKARRMFGMTVFYRTRMIFAALPLTRSFETPTAVAFKLYRKTAETLQRLERDPLVLRFSAEAPKWIVLELRDEKDLAHALKWFGIAYRACLDPRAKRGTPTARGISRK